jgi:hypothetical protein
VRKLKILIEDESTVTRNIIERALRQAGPDLGEVLLAVAAGVAGDQPGRAGANETTGGTAESQAQSVVSGLNGDESRFTPNADTDLEASQILACGQLRYNAQAAFSNAETASVPGRVGCSSVHTRRTGRRAAVQLDPWPWL